MQVHCLAAQVWLLRLREAWLPASMVFRRKCGEDERRRLIFEFLFPTKLRNYEISVQTSNPQYLYNKALCKHTVQRSKHLKNLQPPCRQHPCHPNLSILWKVDENTTFKLRYWSWFALWPMWRSLNGDWRSLSQHIISAHSKSSKQWQSRQNQNYSPLLNLNLYILSFIWSCYHVYSQPKEIPNKRNLLINTGSRK